MIAVKRQRTSTFSNEAGQDIFYRNWITEHKPRAIVLIVHGLHSHSGYYQSFAAELNENHYEVYAVDLPGRGRSAGERYYIPDYRDIVGDIDRLLSIASAAHPEAPVFLLGHGAGGLFASIYALGHQSGLKGLISESSGFETSVSGPVPAAIEILARIIPRSGLMSLNSRHLSRDQSLVNDVDNDPLLANEKLQVKTVQQLQLASGFLKKEMAELKLPLLILHGTADQVARPCGSIYLMEHASSPDRQLKLYEGYYHDLLNDKCNGIIISDIVDWLNKRT